MSGMPVHIIEYNTRRPYEIAVSVAGTAAGTLTAFANCPDIVSVYADLDTWIHDTSAGTGTAGDGSNGGRVFVPAGSIITIPWNKRGFFVLNAVTGETPAVKAIGWDRG